MQWVISHCVPYHPAWRHVVLLASIVAVSAHAQMVKTGNDLYPLYLEWQARLKDRGAGLTMWSGSLWNVNPSIATFRQRMFSTSR